MGVIAPPVKATSPLLEAGVPDENSETRTEGLKCRPTRPLFTEEWTEGALECKRIGPGLMAKIDNERNGGIE